MASTMAIKRSDPKVYDFSEPINNLHEGKASSGKDFRSPTKKGLEYPSFQALISLQQTILSPSSEFNPNNKFTLTIILNLTHFPPLSDFHPRHHRISPLFHSHSFKDFFYPNKYLFHPHLNSTLTVNSPSP